ncbi:uncharacterized protein LOC117107827 [Anneissia japonica]|uniref:uncharacterized protein LOC117107827 n=1 Tax=Anneissia japonica TaxID=1529436 RepID=UPI0014258F5D|nr:uncharacterized protein LOC117107827 [Anneissia japonica]
METICEGELWGEPTDKNAFPSITSNTNMTGKRDIKRTAMGEYIISDGEAPLTQQAIPLPGPADYQPKSHLTSPLTPQYSIVGRPKPPKLPHHPGPADYETYGDLVLRNKHVTFKSKGITCPHGVPSEHHLTCSLGPAGYSVQYNNTGKHAPKVGMSSRHAEGVNAGHPSQLVQPVDTYGVRTPGPNVYRPKSPTRGPRKSFGCSRRTNADTLGPGPAGYTIEETSLPGHGPAYSLSKRLSSDWQKVTDNPSPNEYNIGTTIGKGVAMSIHSRQPLRKKGDDSKNKAGPSPNAYIMRDLMTYSNAPAHSMTYKPFENTHAFSCGRHCKPCFPDILEYPDVVKDNTPGPGAYHRPRKFTDNDRPAYTMKGPAKSKTNEVPGPNHYDISVSHRPDGKSAPRFSMAKRCTKPVIKNDNPGPNVYNPRADTNDGPSYSMTKRPKQMRLKPSPAPNSYTVGTGQTSKGHYTGPKATFKSRGSPYVYGGYALQASVRLLQN